MRKKNSYKFFQDHAYDFEVRYDEPSWVDRVLRKSIFLRLDEALSGSKELKCKTVLDVGCGYGFQARRFAEDGMDVLGIDFAQNMIKDAVRMSQQIRVSGKLEFSCIDFLDFVSDKKFDAVMALGVFDYIKEPQEFLKKMATLALKCVIVSFPARDDVLSLQRKIRYELLKNVHLYFYTKPSIEKIIRDCGIVHYDLKRINRDYILKIYI